VYWYRDIYIVGSPTGRPGRLELLQNNVELATGKTMSEHELSAIASHPGGKLATSAADCSVVESDQYSSYGSHIVQNGRDT
jgi:hypothetical protein